MPGSVLLLWLLLVVTTFALTRAGVHPGLYGLLTWPGTVAHETAHGLVGWALGARPTSFSVIPRNAGGYWVLGSVTFSNITWWNAVPTAMAPTLLAPLAFALVPRCAMPAWDAGAPATAFGWFMLAVLLLQAAWPSPQDFRIAAPGLLLLALLGYAWWHWRG